MKQTFKTLSEAELFISKCNEILGYPDGKGTDTYSIPEEVKDENDNVIEYNIEITNELNEILVSKAIENIMQ